MTESERLQKFVRTSQIAALLSFAVVVSLIVYGSVRLASVQRQISQKQQRLKDLQDEITRSEKSLQELIQTANEQQKTLAVVQRSKTSALLNVIQPKAQAIPAGKDNNGRQLYAFKIWIEVPEDRKGEIKKVTYKFDHPSFAQKEQSSEKPADGFAVGYTGWGALRLMTITVELTDGTSFPIYFDMYHALGWG